MALIFFLFKIYEYLYYISCSRDDFCSHINHGHRKKKEFYKRCLFHHVMNNNNILSRRMISFSSSCHYLDICICINNYVCMRYDIHSLTSLGRLVFYYYDFDNYLFFFLSTAKYFLCDKAHSTESNDSNVIGSKRI